MQTVMRARGWSEWEYLGERTLKTGDRLRVQWPNGTLSEETVIVQTHMVPTQDMWHTYNYPHSSAYVQRDVDGVPTLVPILGLQAELLAFNGSQDDEDPNEDG